jgi:hypothetical protein
VSIASRSSSGRSRHRPVAVLVAIAVLAAALAPVTMLQTARGASPAPTHLVISEVVTGGTSASDELIELHNPTTSALPLEGLEVIYVTSTGATITQRAAWEVGAPSVSPGGHVLIANGSGIYAPIADATYASGIAATGGSVAIRILGASTAVDAVGWGATTSTWREGVPAEAPVAGASIERLPGGALGSAVDTDDNASDFAERLVPGPQNLASPPTPDPAGSPPPSVASPTPGEPTATPEPMATPGPTPTPPPSPPTGTPVAEARAAPDGTTVTIEGVTLTGSDFHDGGGFVADATGGIAVLLGDGSFGPGQRVRVTGEIDDRFSQRTLRADAGALVVLGPASADPAPITASTGTLGESVEGRLVRIVATIVGRPTALTSGMAFDVDDGSGAARVLVGTVTGIQTVAWASGTTLELVGVAGQRDSSGSGTDGYRVLPRRPGDVSVRPHPTASQTPSQSAGDVTPIRAARAAAEGTRLRIRGVVTVPTGLVDEQTAVVQDGTGAILLRLGGDAGPVRLGGRVEVDGTRSTFGGMESLRATAPPGTLGTAPEPAAREMRTGDVGEPDEAMLVVVRGAIVASARRWASGTVSFEVDDGSGPLRISLASPLGADPDPLGAGTWVEVRGVVGQETSGSEPNEGYRIWPRVASEVRVTAPVAGGSGSAGASGAGSGGEGSGSPYAGPTGSLDDLGAADLSRLRIAATIVVGPWEEVSVGGLLWDGARLVAIHPSSGSLAGRLTRERRPPIALDLGGLQAAGSAAVIGVPMVRLGSAAGQTTPLDAAPAAPRAKLAGGLPAWVSVVGQLSGPATRPVLIVDGARVVLEDRCADDDHRAREGMVAVTGVAIGEPLRLLVPCGGIRKAPTVAGGATGAGPEGSTDPSGPGFGMAAQPAMPDVRRPIVAALLLTAGIVLVGGAALRRRRSPDDDAPVSGADSTDATEPGSHLTLLRVPDESGP